MVFHSSVSLDYLEGRLKANLPIQVMDRETTEEAVSRQWRGMRYWRNLGYTYAPQCDSVTPDGRCAGHRRE